MAGAPAEEPTTVCHKIYTPINASAAKAKSSRRISRYIKKQIRRNIHSASVTHPRHLLLPYSHFPFLFFFFSSPPPSLPSLLSLPPPLLSPPRCCHANFPGDSVVMDTERQGRSADVWCRSGMCTNRPSCMCALLPARLVFDPSRRSSSSRSLSPFSFVRPLIPPLRSVSSKPSTTPRLQCDHIDLKKNGAIMFNKRDVCWL